MAKIPQIVKDNVDNLIAGGSVVRDTVSKIKQGYEPRKIEFEIGDIQQNDFYPQFKTKHWDNECNFSARLVTTGGSVVEDDGKLGYDDGEKIARFYEKDTGDEDGGFEFDVVLKSKPTSNVLTWTIQTKELDFFYQPELTTEEIDQGVSRPVNVVGSYAVYHKTKKNNKVGGKEYRTGKVFHIYRPYAEDATGKREWCELNIDEAQGLLTVTIPRQWLNKAAYPVVVDPTFGYTTIGGTNFYWDSTLTDHYRIGTVGTPGASTLDSIHYAAAKETSSGSYTIYSYINQEDSGGAGVHGEITSYSQSNSLTTTATWFTQTAASESLSAATNYIVNAHGNNYASSSNRPLFYYDSSGSNYIDVFSNLTAAQEDPWNDTKSAHSPSIYATYTASGGGSPSSSPSSSASSSPSPSVSSSPSSSVSSSPSPSESASPSSSVSSSPSPSESASPSSSPSPSESSSPSPSVSSSPSPSSSVSSSPSPSVSSSPSPSVSSSPSPSPSSSPSPSESSSPSSSVSSSVSSSPSPSESASPSPSPSSSPSESSSPSSSPSPSVSSSPSPSESSSPSSSPSPSVSSSPSSSPSPSESSSPSPSVSSSPSSSPSPSESSSPSPSVSSSPSSSPSPSESSSPSPSPSSSESSSPSPSVSSSPSPSPSSSVSASPSESASPSASPSPQTWVEINKSQEGTDPAVSPSTPATQTWNAKNKSQTVL